MLAKSRFTLALATSVPLMLLAISPAQAQYKVTGPDGRVTYTDRPPADGSVRVTEVGRPAPTSTAPTGPALPIELRRLSERFPVTLFTSPDCSPCDAGRDHLKQRGIPYIERQVLNNDDAAALERAVAGRTLPALTVGGQALRGFSSVDWTSYLDAAGYPRESRLPDGWQAPAPAPLVARAPVVARPVPAPVPEPAPAPAPPPPGNTIRF